MVIITIIWYIWGSNVYVIFMQSAVYSLLISYYCFNLNYPKPYPLHILHE
jgi:hypothetical protein